MTYCTQCGQASAPNTQFCTRYGAKQIQAAPIAAEPQPRVQTRSGWPFVLVLPGILALVAVIAIGGLFYAGYRLKGEATSVAQTVAGSIPDTSKGAAPNRQELSPDNKDASALLSNLGSLPGGNPEWKLTVEGHADNIGGDAYKLDLSKRRAAAVRRTALDRRER